MTCVWTTPPSYWTLLRKFALCEKCVSRPFRPFYARHNQPTEQAFKSTLTKFQTSLALLDIKFPTRDRITWGLTKTVIRSAVRSNSTIWTILRQHLGLSRIKYSSFKNWSRWPANSEVFLFCWKSLRKRFFVKQNCVQRQSQFLVELVNKRICRIWSDEQPMALQELPMHPKKDCCGLWTFFLHKVQ